MKEQEANVKGHYVLPSYWSLLDSTSASLKEKNSLIIIIQCVIEE